MKTMIKSIKGTRDFYPQEMAIRNFLYQKVRRVSELFGYQEYDGPYLESIELYAAKSGEELVKEQSFVFPDRSGDLITLRPELTPSLARMVAQKQRELHYPLRWWSWGPFWRYERPQRGRGREFFQWNIDLIGVDSPKADAEIVAIAASFFKELGLNSDEVQILVNNRRLMDDQFQELEIPTETRPKVLRWIDRRDKLRHSQWITYGEEIGLSTSQLDGLQQRLGDKDLWQKSPELVRLFPALDALGVAEYVQFAPHIIRGLQYYTGTVFEAWDMKGNFRALFGGGRYDNLVSDVGGTPLPGVGFALGDMVITLLLRELGKLPDDVHHAAVMIATFDESTTPQALELSAELRTAGISTISYPGQAKLNKQLKFANRSSVSIVAILGPDEIKQNKVALKDMLQGTQIFVDRPHVIPAIQKILAAQHAS